MARRHVLGPRGGFVQAMNDPGVNQIVLCEDFLYTPVVDASFDLTGQAKEVLCPLGNCRIVGTGYPGGKSALDKRWKQSILLRVGISGLQWTGKSLLWYIACSTTKISSHKLLFLCPTFSSRWVVVVFLKCKVATILQSS